MQQVLYVMCLMLFIHDIVRIRNLLSYSRRTNCVLWAQSKVTYGF